MPAARQIGAAGERGSWQGRVLEPAVLRGLEERVFRLS